MRERIKVFLFQEVSEIAVGGILDVGSIEHLTDKIIEL